MTDRRDVDLRMWLTRLQSSDRLAIARPGLDLRFELAGLANRVDGQRALLAPQPESRNDGAVVACLLSRREWMAEALGIETAELLPEFQRAATQPLAPVEVDDAPCQEVIHEGDIDLTRILPIPTHNEHDSGPYITAGLFICRNPKTGVQNVSIHRLQVSGPDELGALLLPRHTLNFFQSAEAEDKDLDVAIVIGAPPACLLASQAIVPIDYDELGVAGALGGAPLEVVRCVGSPLKVPAHAEIIIEGRLRANVRAPEGPFGEFPQYYGERADRHVVTVHRITTRRSPLFHTIVGGGLEHLTLGCIPREATILNALQQLFPNVLDVHLPPGGTCRYHLYVKMRPRQRGEAKNVILGALSSHYDVKHVVGVDEDVDIHNPKMVEWAVATRFQADQDLVVVAGAEGSKLDPSTDAGLGAKMGLDATAPVGSPPFKFERIRVPGQAELDVDALVDDTARLEQFLE